MTCLRATNPSLRAIERPGRAGQAPSHLRDSGTWAFEPRPAQRSARALVGRPRAWLTRRCRVGSEVWVPGADSRRRRVTDRCRRFRVSGAPSPLAAGWTPSRVLAIAASPLKSRPPRVLCPRQSTSWPSRPIPRKPENATMWKRFGSGKPQQSAALWRDHRSRERPERQAAVDRSICSRLTSRRSPVRARHRPSPSSPNQRSERQRLTIASRAKEERTDRHARRRQVVPSESLRAATGECPPLSAARALRVPLEDRSLSRDGGTAGGPTGLTG